MELYRVVGDRAVSQVLLQPLSHAHTHAHTSTDTHIYPDKPHTPPHTHYTIIRVHTHTHTSRVVFGPLLIELALYLSLFYLFLFSVGLAKIICSFNVSPPDRRDLNSPPVHTNKRARILLTACRSGLPFMTVG